MPLGARYIESDRESQHLVHCPVELQVAQKSMLHCAPRVCGCVGGFSCAMGGRAARTGPPYPFQPWAPTSRHDPLVWMYMFSCIHLVHLVPDAEHVLHPVALHCGGRWWRNRLRPAGKKRRRSCGASTAPTLVQTPFEARNMPSTHRVHRFFFESHETHFRSVHCRGQGGAGWWAALVGGTGRCGRRGAAGRKRWEPRLAIGGLRPARAHHTLVNPAGGKSSRHNRVKCPNNKYTCCRPTFGA